MKVKKMLARSLEEQRKLLVENKNLKEEIKLLQAEVKDDDICGHWKNDCGTVTIRKSEPGYIAFIKEESSSRQAWIIRQDERLMLHEHYGLCTGRVFHFASSDLLTLGDHGFYVRDSRPAGIVFP